MTPTNHVNDISIRSELSILFLVLLLIVWSIPHTIGVRNTSGTLLLIMTFPYFLEHAKAYGIPHSLKTFWKLLFILTLWILFQALFISPETAWSLKEIRGQWDVPLLFALLGMSLASSKTHGTLYLRIMIYCMILLISHYVFEALHEWNINDTITTRRSGIFGSPVLPSYINAFILAFLVADLYVFFFDRSKMILKVPVSVIIILISLVAFSTYLTRIRLGVIGILALLISGALLIAAYKKPKAAFFSFTLLAFAVLLGFHHYHDDARWNRLFNTVEQASDIEAHDGWIQNPKYMTKELPKLDDNQTVSASNYLRIAWAFKGLEMIIDKPLGVGFGRNAFGHETSREYNVFIGHSHSGLIDWTIGTGIPGLLLWLTFTVYILIYAAKHGFGKNKDPYAVALFLLTMSALYRSTVDSTLRDHMLQMNLFFMAFLMTKISFSLQLNQDSSAPSTRNHIL